MDKHDAVEYGFGCFYLILLMAISFAVGAGMMYFFHDIVGISPMIVSGVMGVGYGLNSVSRFLDRSHSKRRF